MREQKITLSVMPRGLWLLHAALLAALLLPAVGCGRSTRCESNRGPLAGKVMFDEKPLPGGSVTIVSAKDSLYRVTAPIGPQGDFSVGDAPLGEVRVAVETNSMLFNFAAAYVEIPAKYGQPETSGLTATVERDQSPVVFVLQSR